jgi:hypothetical protein
MSCINFVLLRHLCWRHHGRSHDESSQRIMGNDVITEDHRPSSTFQQPSRWWHRLQAKPGDTASKPDYIKVGSPGLELLRTDGQSELDRRSGRCCERAYKDNNGSVCAPISVVPQHHVLSAVRAITSLDTTGEEFCKCFKPTSISTPMSERRW